MEARLLNGGTYLPRGDRHRSVDSSIGHVKRCARSEDVHKLTFLCHAGVIPCADEQCDVAIATLAQLLLQQNKVHDAVTMFARSAEMARTEPELVNALTYECVSGVLREKERR